MKDYQSGKFNQFGEDLGCAINDVYTKSSYAKAKKMDDLDAYEFLVGFFIGTDLSSLLNAQNLYNQINGKGSMIWGLIKGGLQTYNTEG